MKKACVLLMMGALLMLTLSGCGGPRYTLHLDDDGFETGKTEYAAGEKVTVTYDLIGTDTDYRFYLDDDAVELKRTYDPRRGYVLSFRMPEHDVTLYVEARSSMVYVPPLEYLDAGIGGISAKKSDVTEFIYTYDWSGFNALYQRYRFYTEDGAYRFYHETRKAENEYAWAWEAELTASGTVELSVYEWEEFLSFLVGGTAAEPEEKAETGDSGPWMYLNCKAGDTTVRLEYRFASPERQSDFEAYCRSLAGE